MTDHQTSNQEEAMPDLSQHSIRDKSFAEWLLSDHPWAQAERIRRRTAEAEYMTQNAARIREWITATRAKDATGELDDRPPGWRDDLVGLAEGMVNVTDQNTTYAVITAATPDEEWVAIEREKLERDHHIAGNDAYAYPLHLTGPGAAAYPPPPKAVVR